MRDIEKDAAFITITKQIIALETKDSHWDVQTFVGMYASDVQHRDDLLHTLLLFGLAYKILLGAPGHPESYYIWKWGTEN